MFLHVKVVDQSKDVDQDVHADVDSVHESRNEVEDVTDAVITVTVV